MKLKLNQWLIMNREFGLRNYTQTDPGSIKRLVQAYLQLRSENTWFHNIYDKTLKNKLLLEDEVENLERKRKMLFISLTSAQMDINHLKSKNGSLVMKLDTSESMNYTHWFLHALGFVGFGFVAWSLTNMVR